MKDSIAISRNETLDEKKCIICNIADDSVVTTQNGRSKIIAAASLRKDSVSDQLSYLTPDSFFYYHVTIDCYKRFCHKRALHRCQEIEVASTTSEEKYSVNESSKYREHQRR